MKYLRSPVEERVRCALQSASQLRFLTRDKLRTGGELRYEVDQRSKNASAARYPPTLWSGAKKSGTPGSPTIAGDSPFNAGSLGDCHETIRGFFVSEKIRSIFLREWKRFFFRHPARPP